MFWSIVKGTIVFVAILDIFDVLLVLNEWVKINLLESLSTSSVIEATYGSLWLDFSVLVKFNEIFEGFKGVL
jgi:hypothetical protein